MDADALQALFRGAESSLTSDEKAKIAKNFEEIMARSTLAAAKMAMDADVVLVAAGDDGSEEKIRASSVVLQRVSTGFRGILEESPGEIKLWRPGQLRVLHSMTAVRFVMAVVHAVAAHEETPTSGLHVGASSTPALDVLLSACQIADCWDCPSVLAAVGRCVEQAAAAESEPAQAASVLVKLLRLVPEEPTEAWLQLRSVVEKALATHVPIQWLPPVLKSFDLESMCRVINEIGDLEVELKPVTLRGPNMLEKGWWAESRSFYSEETSNPDAKSGRSRGGRRQGAFRLEVYARELDETKEAQEMREKAQTLIAQLETSGGLIGETLTSLKAQLEEDVRLSRLKKVACYLHYSGSVLVLTEGSRLWIEPTDPARETISKQLCDGPEALFQDKGQGWPNWGATEELGGIRVGGKVVISKMHRQCQVLQALQALHPRRHPRLTGSKPAPGPSPIVGCLERLLVASRCRETQVRLKCTLWWGRQIRVQLAPEARTPASEPVGPAAAELCRSLTQLVICRLDNWNGPVNRATATLDQATMLQILETESFPGLNAPQNEKALLRMAVDWASRPWRSAEAIKDVMAQIRFAGVPTNTLMHLDEGSWCHLGLARNHSLSKQLLDLARDHDDVRKHMVEALEAQRMGTHLEDDSGLLRPCFREDPPKFPTGKELYEIGRTAALTSQRHEGASKTANEQREKTETSLKEAMAELERAAKFRGAVLAQRAQKRGRIGAEPHSQQAKCQRSSH